MKKNEPRYRLIANRTGKQVATSNTLEELRQEISSAQASAFTLHDQRWGTFSSAEYLFKFETNQPDA